MLVMKKPPERLLLVNQATGLRFAMKLLEPVFPLEAVSETAAGIMTEILNREISCEQNQAVAISGMDVSPIGSKDDLPKAFFSMFLDLEKVIKNAPLGRIPAKDFRETGVFFEARAPDGQAVGLFLMYGTVIKVQAWSGTPLKLKARIDAALYSTEGRL